MVENALSHSKVYHVYSTVHLVIWILVFQSKLWLSCDCYINSDICVMRFFTIFVSGETNINIVTLFLQLHKSFVIKQGNIFEDCIFWVGNVHKIKIPCDHSLWTKTFQLLFAQLKTNCWTSQKWTTRCVFHCPNDLTFR